MAEVKLTKNELKAQKTKLDQLQKYLPTLQLKKALLQAEVINARHEKAVLDERKDKDMKRLEDASSLLTMDMPFTIEEAVAIETIDLDYENIAGAELPKLKRVSFQPFQYDRYTAPVWIDGLIGIVKTALQTKISIEYATQRLMILEKELREVSIRVNLFEKVLIPRCTENIKKIKVFLGDLQLSQVGQAKVAKTKIMQRKETHQTLTSSL